MIKKHWSVRTRRAVYDNAAPTPGSSAHHVAWESVSRHSVFDTLRSARKDLFDRFVSAVLRQGVSDKYRAALTYGGVFDGAMAPAFRPGLSQANASGKTRAAPPRVGMSDWVKSFLPRRVHHGGVALFSGTTLLFAVIAGALLMSGGKAAFNYTNQESFCVSCHEMRENNFAEYKGSIHDSNRTGVRTTCPDCHVPREAGAAMMRKVGAAVDLYSHFVSGKVDTKKKFEEHRSRMAQKVWTHLKETDSRECRNCHNATAMSSELQSEKAKSRHAKAVVQGKTCIDCHFGIAHNEPKDGPGPQDIEVAGKTP